MARQDKIALRYAKAIFDYSSDPAILRTVVDELRAFATMANGQKDLQFVIQSAVFTATNRREIVEDLAKLLKLSELSRRVLLILAEQKRLLAVNEVAGKLHELLLEASESIPLMVRAAAALNSDERAKVEKSFQQLLGKKVEANYEVDTSLVGGLRVMAAGRTYDGSLAGWLAKIEEQLAEGSMK